MADNTKSISLEGMTNDELEELKKQINVKIVNNKIKQNNLKWKKKDAVEAYKKTKEYDKIEKYVGNFVKFEYYGFNYTKLGYVFDAYYCPDIDLKIHPHLRIAYLEQNGDKNPDGSYSTSYTLRLHIDNLEITPLTSLDIGMVILTKEEYEKEVGVLVETLLNPRKMTEVKRSYKYDYGYK